jgi:hypothetical protein
MMMPVAEANRYRETTSGQDIGGTIVRLGIVIIAVYVFVKVCDVLTQPPKFDTWEEADEYMKKHGLTGNEYLYETNYFSVLSWAKEGMDESIIQDKIGAVYARKYLQSTYSSMGSTVSTYHFTDVYPPGGGYSTVSVWLTFIDGKLFSISTFGR